MSFKTITLRNLDSRENEPVVKILMAFMSKNDIKTGQAAIEEIIKDYDYMKGRCGRLENQIKEMQEAHNKSYSELNDRNNKLENVISNYQLFTQSLKEL